MMRSTTRDRVGSVYTSVTFPETVVLIVGRVDSALAWNYPAPMWQGVALISEALVEQQIIAFDERELAEWYEEI